MPFLWLISSRNFLKRSSFNNCFKHQSAGVRFHREPLEMFAVALSHSFPFFTWDSVGHLLECLVHLHGCLSCIPNSESYLSLCYLSVAKCHLRDSCKLAMRLLFLEKDLSFKQDFKSKTTQG